MRIWTRAAFDCGNCRTLHPVPQPEEGDGGVGAAKPVPVPASIGTMITVA